MCIPSTVLAASPQSRQTLQPFWSDALVKKLKCTWAAHVSMRPSCNWQAESAYLALCLSRLLPDGRHPRNPLNFCLHAGHCKAHRQHTAAGAAPFYGACKLAFLCLLQVLLFRQPWYQCVPVYIQSSAKHTASTQQQVVYLSMELAS